MEINLFQHLLKQQKRSRDTGWAKAGLEVQPGRRTSFPILVFNNKTWGKGKRKKLVLENQYCSGSLCPRMYFWKAERAVNCQRLLDMNPAGPRRLRLLPRLAWE